MITTSSNPDVNYLARVFRVEDIQKHPNADKLQLVTIEGETVVTGLDCKAGAIYVHFTVESAIDSRFLAWSNSFSDAERNHDVTKKGFFPKQGRVKIVTLRGVPSNGYIVPASELEKYIAEFYGKTVNLADFVGQSFDSIGDDRFVKKYIRFVQTPAAPKQKTKGKVKKFETKVIPNQFHFHEDTVNFRKDLGKLSPNDTIVIADKIHGCLDGDTILETIEFGNISIREVVEGKLECRVLSMDLESNEIGYYPITNWMNHGESDDWYEIEMDDGTVIIATGNHPFFLKDLFCYRELQFLQIGDDLLTS